MFPSRRASYKCGSSQRGGQRYKRHHCRYMEARSQLYVYFIIPYQIKYIQFMLTYKRHHCRYMEARSQLRNGGRDRNECSYEGRARRWLRNTDGRRIIVGRTEQVQDAFVLKFLRTIVVNVQGEELPKSSHETLTFWHGTQWVVPHVTWIYVRSGGNLITKVSERKKKRSASQEVVMTKPIFVLRVIMSIFPIFSS